MNSVRLWLNEISSLACVVSLKRTFDSWFVAIGWSQKGMHNLLLIMSISYQNDDFAYLGLCS